MMGKTRSFQEAKATLNGSLLVGNISFGTTYSGLALRWSNANLCNVIEEGQMKEYKKKERQREDWAFSWSNANLCYNIVLKQIEVCQGLAFSRSNANLCDDIVEEQIEEYKKKERQREGWAFSWSNANLCNDIEKGQMEEYKKKERQREGSYLDENFALARDSLAKETQFANRELLEEITNNKKNEMEEAQMEEIEIKEGHDDVDEKQDNKAEETPIANRKLLLEKITNNERNEMKEEPLEEMEVKEGHEVVEEEQDNESLNARIMRVERRLKAGFKRYLQVFAPVKLKAGFERYLQVFAPVKVRSATILCDVIDIGQMEEYKKKERQKERDYLKLSTKPTLMDIERELTEFREEQLGQQLIFREEQLGQQLIFREEQLGQQLIFQGGQSRRKLFISWFGNYVPEEESSERTIKTTLIEMMGKWKQRERNAVVEDDAIMEREKQTDVTEKLSGEFDDEEKEKRELEQLLRCKVCLDSDACVVLFPCRHMATCEYCEGFLQCCPVCRSFIDEAVKVNEEN